MPNKWQNLIYLICLHWTFVKSETFPMLMPNVKPQLPKDESYLCTGTATDPTKELYITGFEPRVNLNQAHHLMVIGCSNPMLGSSNHNLWNCGGTLGETSLDFGGSCQGGDMQVSKKAILENNLTFIKIKCPKLLYFQSENANIVVLDISTLELI